MTRSKKLLNILIVTLVIVTLAVLAWFVTAIVNYFYTSQWAMHLGQGDFSQFAVPKEYVGHTFVHGIFMGVPLALFAYAIYLARGGSMNDAQKFRHKWAFYIGLGMLVPGLTVALMPLIHSQVPSFPTFLGMGRQTVVLLAIPVVMLITSITALYARSKSCSFNSKPIHMKAGAVFMIFYLASGLDQLLYSLFAWLSPPQGVEETVLRNDLILQGVATLGLTLALFAFNPFLGIIKHPKSSKKARICAYAILLVLITVLGLVVSWLASDLYLTFFPQTELNSVAIH